MTQDLLYSLSRVVGEMGRESASESLFLTPRYGSSLGAWCSANAAGSIC